jgi:MFS family permease
MARQRKLHYAWVVAGVTFLTLLVAAGLRATPAVLIVPLENEFGWSRATISFAIGLNIFLYGLIGPFAAAVMDRFGLRRTMLAALACIVAGVALTPLMTRPSQLVALWGVMVGTASGATALVLGATVVTRWFAARRGLVIGILTAGTATGQLIFLPLLASLAENYGWRTVSLTVAAVALALIPVVAVLMRDRPRDIGLAPYGADDDLQPVAALRGSPAATALFALRDGPRSRDFWLLAGSFFICGASTNGLIGTHLIPACLDHGIPQVTSASLLAAMGLFDLVGTTLSGWLSDRWSNRGLLAWYYGLRGLSLLYLPFAFDLSFYGLSLFAIFYGLDWIATVPPTVRLATKAFGTERGPIMFGWIAAAHQL